MRRGQTASEYLLMVGGVIFFAVFIFLVIKGELVPGATRQAGGGSASLIDEYGKPYAFYDTFDSGRILRWKTTTETWKVENYKLLQENAGSKSFALSGDAGWDNYIIRVDVNVSGSPLTSGGIAFRFADDGSHYECGVSGDSLELRKCSASCTTLTSTPVTLSGWQQLSARANGSQLNCTMGGFSVSASDYSYLYGKPGLYSDSQGQRFDDFKVTKLPQIITTPTMTPTPTPEPLFIFDELFSAACVDTKDGQRFAVSFAWSTNLPSNSTYSYRHDSWPNFIEGVNSTDVVAHVFSNIPTGTGCLCPSDPQPCWYYKMKSCTPYSDCSEVSGTLGGSGGGGGGSSD